ncbi:MAG: BNR-4 repeat-containing protein [Pontiellaceae bacterium]|nr:BNR-4 repeat-containing protein [Pontiellaceae bacterium]MBN2785769.1 BNR-4 repeat-containing protein [Pontiellaceae bacterium]
MYSRLTAGVIAVTGLLAGCISAQSSSPVSEPITFMHDGGWCWFQDPRAIIRDGKLILGGIDGQNGDVKVSVYDLAADQDLGTVTLHEQFEADDHNAPALYARPDGRLLAVYSKHANDHFHYYRISEPDSFLEWGEEQQFLHEYEGGWGITYMNLYYLQNEGLLYNFFRDGKTINPCFITSSDQGTTWSGRTHLITDELGWDRPYARYFQGKENGVGISFTDAHPRQYGNNLYYAEFRDGAFYRADGKKIKDLAAGPLKPSEAERIYRGSETKKKPDGCESVPNSAWCAAMATDADGRPVLGYSLYINNEDHRYHIAAWNGERWIDREVAYAGNCLYPAESSYTGLIAIDPEDPSRVVISTDVNPKSGAALGGRHEIYAAEVGSDDNVHSIQWRAVTRDSGAKNIRPMIVSGGGYKVLVWLRGDYTTYTDYTCDAVGLVLERP